MAIDLQTDLRRRIRERPVISTQAIGLIDIHRGRAQIAGSQRATGIVEQFLRTAAALRDPVLAPALAQLHASPERRWTVADLAGRAAASRSLLDQRFRQVLGRSPIRYLTEWRMHIARQLLASTDLGVAQVARVDRGQGRAEAPPAFEGPASLRLGRSQAIDMEPFLRRNLQAPASGVADVSLRLDFLLGA